MKCPKCNSTIKKWATILTERRRDKPDEPLDLDNEDLSNVCDVTLREGQCHTCFAICEQTISLRKYQNTWPVKVTKELNSLSPYY